MDLMKVIVFQWPVQVVPLLHHSAREAHQLRPDRPFLSAQEEVRFTDLGYHSSSLKTDLPLHSFKKK